jgi:vitamin B12/bleomycin/antimicrobial peptide transport system ATP-binding/permease protein
MRGPTQEERSAQLLLGGVILLTLASSATSVWFSYIGRDFWTALSSKNEAQFYEMMIRCARLVSATPTCSACPAAAFWCLLLRLTSTCGTCPVCSNQYSFFGALVVGVPINVLYRYQRGKLSLSWREWLTNRLMEVSQRS